RRLARTLNGKSVLKCIDPREFDNSHIVDVERAFLERIGIRSTPCDFSSLGADLARLNLPRDYALLLPGGGIAKKLETRAPGLLFAKLAQAIAAKGLVPIIFGKEQDAELLTFVQKRCLRSRLQKNDLAPSELATLARHAAFAVGNDSGYIHFMAALGKPCLSLATPLAKPEYQGPRGSNVRILLAENLQGLSLSDLLDELPYDFPAVALQSNDLETDLGFDPVYPKAKQRFPNNRRRGLLGMKRFTK
ncbi:MAG: glycosyltransferase family 9 protein, partial [Kiloniellales bacterium]|nr:glycosyltransferase family 9 protein [Kiloniellales bacterium]